MRNKQFIGREAELDSLSRMYQSPDFEMAVMYGRRRVGKTSLIQEFIKDKPAIYVQGVEATKDINLHYLTNAILDFENPDRLDRTFSYTDFRDAFDKVQDLANAQSEKLIFVMDEFPYFAESAQEVSSVLQYAIDHIFKKNDNIMLILCGSSMSFMQHQVLGHKSPLYGRKTGQFKILPFDIFNTKKMLPKVSNEDLLAYYGITGGVPQYLAFIDQDKSVKENINDLFLHPNAVLQDEPNVLLQEELRKPATYYSILAAIAHGKSKPNEIGQEIGIPANNLGPYLARLKELEIIDRKGPILDHNNRKMVYLIKDQMFRFWFTYIASAQDKIAMLRTKATLEKIMHDLNRFLGSVFEKATIDWMWKEESLPLEPEEIANWWGNNPLTKRQEEIDIVAINFDNTEAIIGECKWRDSSKLSNKMLATLQSRALLFQSIDKLQKTYLYFFVKDCNDDFLEEAAEQGIKVVKFDDYFAK